jgi:hypothetical protein
VIEPMLTEHNSRRYKVVAGNANKIKVWIHNYSKSDLTFDGVYVNEHGDEESQGGMFLFGHQDESRPADERELWFPLAQETAATRASEARRP